MAGPAGRLDVVLVCGGRWHDFDYARMRLLEALGRHERARTRVFEDYAMSSAAGDALGNADLLITYTCDRRPDPDQQRRLVDWVGAGGRWLALHGPNSPLHAPPPKRPRPFPPPPPRPPRPGPARPCPPPPALGAGGRGCGPAVPSPTRRSPRTGSS